MSDKKKSDALPEFVSDDTELISATKGAVDARKDKAVAEASEKGYKEDMVTAADSIRTDQYEKGEFVGVIKVIDPDIPPTRIEFRINNGAIATTQMDYLNKIFGGVRPALFEKAEVVTEITDPSVLIDELKNNGHNPWSYLKLSVKKDMDHIVAPLMGCESAEAILPKKGFLARLKENTGTFSREAMAFLKKYLDESLKTYPILGTKGKS